MTVERLAPIAGGWKAILRQGSPQLQVSQQMDARTVGKLVTSSVWTLVISLVCKLVA